MGELVRAQAWQGAGNALANLSTTFATLLPITDKMIGNEQTKLAMDEFLKRTQNIKGPGGEKTDAAAQLFSMVFGYDPALDSELDNNGLGLMQDLLDLSKDAVLSKDIEGFKSGLGAITGEINEHVKKLQATKPRVAAAPGVAPGAPAAPGVSQFAPERLEAQAFRQLQAQQRQQEAAQKQVAGISTEISAAFPRADQKKLKSFVETFSQTLEPQDFNELIEGFVKTRREKKLNDAKILAQKLVGDAAKVAKTLKIRKPTAEAAELSELFKDTHREINNKISSAAVQMRLIRNEVAKAIVNEAYATSEEAERKFKIMEQEVVSLENQIKVNKAQLKGIKELRAELAPQVTKLDEAGAERLSARFNELTQGTFDIINDLNNASERSVALIEKLKEITGIDFNAFTPDQIKEFEEAEVEFEKPGFFRSLFGGGVGKIVTGEPSPVTAAPGDTTGFVPGIPQADTTAGAAQFGQQEQQTDFGPAGKTPENSLANNPQGQLVRVVNGRWKLVQ